MQVEELERINKEAAILREKRRKASLTAEEAEQEKRQEAKIELGRAMLEFFKSHKGAAYTAYEISKEMRLAPDELDVVSQVLPDLAHERMIRWLDVSVEDEHGNVRAELESQISPDELKSFADRKESEEGIGGEAKVSYYYLL